METLTRNKAAKNLGVASTHLLYWEKKGRLVPRRTQIGDLSLVIYSPELLEEARKVLSRDNRKKREEVD